jgi:two-component system, LytTR family, response regulator
MVADRTFRAAPSDHVLTVMIVDDEPAALRTLREYCGRERDLHIVGEYANGVEALEAIRSRPPDVVFLDVQMTPLTGIALARALDPATLPQIVFVTAYDRFALAAFEVSAVDYVVKPFDFGRFGLALERVRYRHRMESLAQRETALADVLKQLEQSARALREPRPKIMGEADGRMRVLDVGHIEMIESERNYIRLTVGRQVYTTRSTLQHAETSLSAQPMLRISRSCLVNLDHVREIGRTRRGDVIMQLAGGATVTSSERFRAAVREELHRMQLWPRES